MSVTPEQYQRTAYQATHDPARPLLAFSLAGVFLWAWIYLGMAAEPSIFHRILIGFPDLLSITTFATVLYQVPRLLILTRRILDEQVQVRLFGHQPLQTLPTVFAGVAFLTSLISIAALLLIGSDWDNILYLIFNLFPTLLCIGALLVSVQGVHVRLVIEKRERMLQTSRQLDELSVLLPKAVDERSFAEVDGINKSIVALQNELNMLEKAPTWPWNPDTVRVILTAILLPILVWIAQRILGRFGL